MGSVLPRIKPMSLRLVREAFDDPAFLFELKHDGFRAVCYIDNGECRLVSRNLRNLRFESLQKTLARLPVQDAILDGEIICLDQNGVSQFNGMLERSKEPVFYAFDLLWIDGTELKDIPLIERKNRLSEFVQSSECNRLLYAQHIEEYGRHFVKEICERDLEGIVAKRRMSVYKAGGNGWLKIKNKAYSQAEGRHELLTKRK
jgi:bifunctional non-homologous end joining protein LigD